ncbi:hypothetical protein SmJEL517_g01996 [Synchytrium microbalum]|uniref:Uncharacterized protein n=1 Tax=Synchytrium microbalum TaxID=1806994 RepID=A0A507C860_9FUNG|nr:uncharacterized protein SmJEL517_g01996 [Synchytrium microbalum]TPX35802.1 hypothetical protein SmJEL517_g01996 [Synchytrium microbalum]
MSSEVQRHQQPENVRTHSWPNDEHNLFKLSQLSRTDTALSQVSQTSQSSQKSLVPLYEDYEPQIPSHPIREQLSIPFITHQREEAIPSPASAFTTTSNVSPHSDWASEEGSEHSVQVDDERMYDEVDFAHRPPPSSESGNEGPAPSQRRFMRQPRQRVMDANTLQTLITGPVQAAKDANLDINTVISILENTVRSVYEVDNQMRVQNTRMNGNDEEKQHGYDDDLDDEPAEEAPEQTNRGRKRRISKSLTKQHIIQTVSNHSLALMKDVQRLSLDLVIFNDIWHPTMLKVAMGLVPPEDGQNHMNDGIEKTAPNHQYQTITRYEIEDDKTIVAYGTGVLCGILLWLKDKRIHDEYGSSGYIGAVANEKWGGEQYFALQTSPNGLGIQVSVATMKVFLERYGVTEAQIVTVMRALEELDARPERMLMDLGTGGLRWEGLYCVVRRKDKAPFGPSFF